MAFADSAYELPTKGEHLASGNVYRLKIAAAQKRNPNFRYRDWKVPVSRRGIVPSSRVRLLSFGSDNSLARSPQPLELSDLKTLLERPRANDPPQIRRLFLLEGLNPDFVEVFGKHFDIDPALFVRHQRTGLWEGRHHAGNTPPLSSSETSSGSFMLEYSQLHFFLDAVPGPSMRNPSDNRHINMCKRIGNTSEIDRVGSLHQKASFWSTRCQNGGWDALLILDPPLCPAPGINPTTSLILVGNLYHAQPQLVSNELYQGGYVDFIPHNYIPISTPLGTPARGPPRSSMMDDLCYYWQTFPGFVKLGEDPLLCTIFLQKIIASHYLLQVEYLRSFLSELESTVARTHTLAGFQHGVESAAQSWTVLQTCTRRLPQYTRMLAAILTLYERPDGPKDRQWNDCRKDFLDLKERFDALSGSAEEVSSSFVGLAGIASSIAGLHNMAQSLQEAHNVRILTFLALFFLPLSYVASLFSMADDYRPEGARFWLYCAISFPIAGTFSILALLIISNSRGISLRS